MTKEEIYKAFKNELLNLDERDLRNITKIYFEDVEDINHAKIKDDADKLRRNIPLQYITGKDVFLDYTFKVNPSVLIPRPETEELVVWIMEEYKGSAASLNCLDVGTGSGIIPISIKLKFPNWNVQAVDVSGEALGVAKENAARLQADVVFKEADFLNNENWVFGDIDLLISNPPYISFAEAEKMGASVVKHEPHIALFVDDDPLIFYKTLCEFSLSHLKADGSVFVELNEFNSSETESIFKSYFQEVEIRKDLQGKDRMLMARHLLSSHP